MKDTTSREIPANARGASASRGYWLLGERDRARYSAGWWDEYDRKPCASHEFAYLLGRNESRAAHSHAMTSVAS